MQRTLVHAAAQPLVGRVMATAVEIAIDDNRTGDGTVRLALIHTDFYCF
jgi:hypothetical protein